MVAKYDVTPELSETIKTIRIQNHITSKAIAQYIGKSQSYMTKLEKGAIKSIEEKELTKIFRFIFGNDKGFQDFLNSSLGTIFSTLEIRFSDKEIEEQVWFQNYDTVFRMIPIPIKIIEDINNRMRSLKLSINELCVRINANEDISSEISNLEQYPYNEWQAFVLHHKIKFLFIKMKMSEEQINKILNGSIRSTNYVSILAIVYYINKIEKYGSSIEIDDDAHHELMKKTQHYLSKYKFYSIAIKNKLNREARSETEKNELLSSFDKENITAITEILKAFKLFSEIDIINTNKMLDAFIQNLNWDSGFMMNLLSLSFAEIGQISFTAKKQMLLEIKAINEKYKNIPYEKKCIESYN